MSVTEADERRRTADLVLAQAVQQALLPKECPHCEGALMAARYRPAEHVGGDFYDFMHLGPEQIGLLIGDVIGHGINSALVMALLLGHLRANRPQRLHPAKVINEANDLLVKLGDDTDELMLCTMFYAVLDIPSRILFYLNAGHHPPLCCRQGQVTSLTTNALLLGVQEFQAEEQCHQFEPGDRMMLYTDGIIEARNSQGDLFSLERLTEILRKQCGNPAEQAVNNIFTELESFSSGQGPDDDATVVVLDFA